MASTHRITRSLVWLGFGAVLCLMLADVSPWRLTQPRPEQSRLARLRGYALEMPGLETKGDDPSLERQIQQRTGPDAVDCGTLGPGSSVKAMRGALACGLRARRSGRAFRVIRYEQGVDSLVARGLFAGSVGSIYNFWYDSICVSKGGQRGLIETHECPSPRVRRDADRGLVFVCTR